MTAVCSSHALKSEKDKRAMKGKSSAARVLVPLKTPASSVLYQTPRRISITTPLLPRLSSSFEVLLRSSSDVGLKAALFLSHFDDSWWVVDH